MAGIKRYLGFIISGCLLVSLCVSFLYIERHAFLGTGFLASSHVGPASENGPLSSQLAIPLVVNSLLGAGSCQTPYNGSHSAFKFQIAGYNHTHVRGCLLPECDLNNNHTPVKILTCDVKADVRVAEEVTLIVKTSQRLTETERLIRSLHQYYPGLKAVIVDDNANITTSSNATAELEKQRMWEDFVYKSNGLVRYIKLPGNAGISKGRNVALRLVKSKYFLLLDDDVIATSNNNLLKMVDLLDRTDLSVIAGVLKQERGGILNFAGIVKAHQKKKSNHIQLYEYFSLAYEEISFFPSCYVVDYVLNVFVAKTEHIMKFGGWDENLPVGEHRDFLLGLRKAGYKLACCADTVFEHRPPNHVLHKHTWAKQETISKPYYGKKWNLPWKQIFQCERKRYFDHKCR